MSDDRIVATIDVRASGAVQARLLASTEAEGAEAEKLWLRIEPAVQTLAKDLRAAAKAEAPQLFAPSIGTASSSAR
jgi:hypothetical protein